LRPVEQDDLERLVHWRNEPDHWTCFFNKFPLSLAGQKQWFERLLNDAAQQLFIICTRRDGSAIGTMGLSNIDFANQSAELGNCLIGDSDARGKGYAKAATQLMLKYCFKRLNMNRVYLYVYANNQPAVRLYEQCGFTLEGTLRAAQFEDGRYQDVLLMSILRGEFAQ
jgi:UDP-4-amino-4,6-dideoxy-N-acetyl-beta-L-altrosamine N-acetyltransferase